MIHRNRKETNQILSVFPQLENLTENQYLILEFLKTQRIPKLPKTISARLGIPYNTVRARLSELLDKGYVYQPNKTAHLISQLNESGICNVSTLGKKCGYSAVTFKH